QTLLPRSKNCWRNKRSAGGIVHGQGVAHPLGGKKNSCCKPNSAQGEIETARYLGKRSDFRIINAAESVRLHHSMPNTPDKHRENDAIEVPPRESNTRYEQKQRRENKAPLEAFEQSPITVGAYHTREVMAYGTEGSDKEVNILRTPFRLGQRERRYQQ